MDPESRLLKRLTVDDAAQANYVFSSLMGARVRNFFSLGRFIFFQCSLNRQILVLVLTRNPKV